MDRISSAIADTRSRRAAPEGSAKIKVENLHYDLGPEDIKVSATMGLSTLALLETDSKRRNSFDALATSLHASSCTTVKTVRAESPT